MPPETDASTECREVEPLMEQVTWARTMYVPPGTRFAENTGILLAKKTPANARVSEVPLRGFEPRFPP